MNYLPENEKYDIAGRFTGTVIGFNQTLYEVNENEPVALTFVIITSGILRREVAINVSTQDDTALGILITTLYKADLPS